MIKLTKKKETMKKEKSLTNDLFGTELITCPNCNGQGHLEDTAPKTQLMNYTKIAIYVKIQVKLKTTKNDGIKYEVGLKNRHLHNQGTFYYPEGMRYE